MILHQNGKKAQAYQGAIIKNKFGFQSCSSLQRLLLNTRYFCFLVENTVSGVKLDWKVNDYPFLLPNFSMEAVSK